jgi:hypothetical protein
LCRQRVRSAPAGTSEMNTESQGRQQVWSLRPHVRAQAPALCGTTNWTSTARSAGIFGTSAAGHVGSRRLDTHPGLEQRRWARRCWCAHALHTGGCLPIIGPFHADMVSIWSKYQLLLCCSTLCNCGLSLATSAAVQLHSHQRRKGNVRVKLTTVCAVYRGNSDGSARWRPSSRGRLPTQA